ncbi:MAG: alpha/beta hydrolase-fold protein [Candidatus Eisenbacteria bacterium]
MHASWLFVVPLLALAAVTAGAQSSTPAPGAGRFVPREVKVGHERHKFLVWLPPGHDAGRHWPAILFLHGSGESGTDGERPTWVGLGPALKAHPEQWPYVVVFPQKPTDQEEWEERESLALAALDDAVRTFGVDAGRVALMGMSQGGHGAWLIGARHPERWRCLVPICGYGRPHCIVGRIAELPVWAFHGLRDDVVDPRETEATIAQTQDVRRQRGLDPATARLTLFPEANHNAWDPAIAHDSLHVWLAEWLAPRTNTGGSR